MGWGRQVTYRGLTVAVVLSSLATGCTTVGPDFKRPDVQVEQEWINSADPKIAPQAMDVSQWWKVFNDPVLDSLIETAYQQNLPLQIAGVRILEARAQLGISVGNQYPQLQQVGAEATANRLSENAPNSAAANRSFYNYFAGFDTSWELDIWGRFRRGVEASEADLIASIADYDDVLVALTAEVARNYILLRTAQERARLARQNVKIQERSLRIAKVRFRNGVTTELDVTQATTLLRRTQSQVPVFETQERQFSNAISILLGMPPQDLKDILGPEKPIPTAPAEVAVGIPADLLRRRPDVRFAELQAAAQSARIGVAQADLYPAFSLIGSIGLQSSDKGSRSSNNADFGDIFETDSVTYFVGPTLSWNIFNYGRIKNNVRVQDARLEQALINYQDTVLRAAQEVEDAMVEFLKALDRERFLADSVKAASRSVDLSLIQYRDGVTDYQRVLDSQDSLTTEQDNYAATAGDIATSLVATYKALGGGWEFRQGQPFVSEATLEQMRDRTDWGKLLPPKDLPETQDPPASASEQPLFPSPDW